MWISPRFQELILAMCAVIKTNFLFTTVNIMEINRRLKSKLRFSKWTEMIKSDTDALHGSHIFDHETRTNNNWNAVEPSLELGNIDQSCKKVVVAYSVKFCNLGPLFTMVTFNNDLPLPIEEPRFNSILRIWS